MNTSKTNKGWNITLWITQSILAAFFLMAGLSKFMNSIEAQRAQMEWANHVSGGLIHFIGVMEILGALGLILPALLKIKPGLTPLAALGLAIIMVLATGLNVSIGEYKAISILVISAIALFIAWGRYKKAPVEPKK